MKKRSQSSLFLFCKIDPFRKLIDHNRSKNQGCKFTQSHGQPVIEEWLALKVIKFQGNRKHGDGKENRKQEMVQANKTVKQELVFKSTK